MTDAHSKSRKQAEIAFGATQTQFFARGHAVDELNSITQAREEKTIRLREARLAKELEDSKKPPAIAPPKRVKKS
ncbi:hypothetical protein RMR16_000570 [Agrobacterium sp. rho-13.3]|uniref:hypothetical protein n=1 Tax=Agrobacterium sp. rho-13.3 TaxID=3072980 RepID=UPI002A0D193D|nr:hypothetical protein [Agrobacterium sp. rho-13.3]MDX8310850.1 hypothetical protein [Agrobacterium sp. rho-13.3]